MKPIKIDILKESKQDLNFEVYKCFCIIKTSRKISKVDIFNSLRAVEGVITLDVEKKYESQFLISPPGADYEKSLIKLKFLVSGGTNPEEELDNIKSQSLNTHGLHQFLTIKRSIKKV